MSYRSDKCSIQELADFKAEVITWLNTNFPDWSKKFKLRAFRCYNGDVRLYCGEYLEISNKKSSFRRSKAIKNDEGQIVKYEGTRGHHITRIVNSIAFNRNEWERIKKSFQEKSGDDYPFMKDYYFNKLAN